jgi:hypothetical protein
VLPSGIKVGYILKYSYLWHWQHLQGREEGEKDRPSLVLAIVGTDVDGRQIVRVLPVTHSPPANAADAVEIPASVKARLNLDHERSWILLTESNSFAWPGPDIRPVDTDTGYIGALPPFVFDAVKRRFVETVMSKRHQTIARTE